MSGVQIPMGMRNRTEAEDEPLRDTVDYVQYVRQEERHKRYIQYPLITEEPKPKREPIQWKNWFQSSIPVIDASRIYHRTIHVPMTQYLIILCFCILSGLMVWNIVNMRQTQKRYEYIANTYNTVVEENNRLNQILFESYDKEYLYDAVEAFGLIPLQEAERYIIDVENQETTHVEN